MIQEKSQPRRTAHQAFARVAGRALVAGLAFTAMAPAVEAFSTASAQTQKAAYDPKVNPLEAGQDIRSMADAVMGAASNTKGRMDLLFSTLSTSSEGGVTVVASDGRPPNTAMQTAKNGGDCTEFAYLVLAIINAMNAKGADIKAEAQVVHFRSSPADKEHMFVTVDIHGKKTIIDLQASDLGETKKGKYEVVLTLTPDNAAAMYHREYGDYLRDVGNQKEAMAAYERSLEIYAGDPYVHQNLGILYEKAGDMAAAKAHYDRANVLAPGRYAMDKARGDYNSELKEGERDYNGGDWAGCKSHFTNALGLGRHLKHDDSLTILDYINDCDKRQK